MVLNSLRQGFSMRYIISAVKEISDSDMRRMQQQLEEVKSIVGDKADVVIFIQDALDNAEKIA